MNTRIARLAVVGAGLTVLTCCGSRAAAPASTSLPAAVSSSVAPATTASTVPEIVGSVTNPVDTTGSAEPAAVIHNDVPPVIGTTYTTGTTFAPRIRIRFVPADGAGNLLEAPAYLAMAGSDTTESWIQVVDLDIAKIVSDTTVDLAKPGDVRFLNTPTDYLDWFAHDAAVTAEPIQDTTVDGLPARSMRYKVGTTPRSKPCFPNHGTCLTTLTVPSGITSVNFDGDSGIMYQLTIDGVRLMIDVEDRPGAAETFATMHFVAPPPGTAGADGRTPIDVGDAVPVPLPGTMTAGTSYWWVNSSIGTYLFHPTIEILTDQSPAADPLLYFGQQGKLCGVIRSGTFANWYDIVSAPAPVDGPEPPRGGPFPPDLESAITNDKLLTVVDPPKQVRLGDAPATVIGVRAAGDDVFLTDSLLLVTHNATTRLVVVNHADGSTQDLIEVIDGSPCSALIDTVKVHFAK